MKNNESPLQLALTHRLVKFQESNINRPTHYLTHIKRGVAMARAKLVLRVKLHVHQEEVRETIGYELVLTNQVNKCKIFLQ